MVCLLHKNELYTMYRAVKCTVFSPAVFRASEQLSFHILLLKVLSSPHEKWTFSL